MKNSKVHQGLEKEEIRNLLQALLAENMKKLLTILVLIFINSTLFSQNIKKEFKSGSIIQCFEPENYFTTTENKFSYEVDFESNTLIYTEYEINKNKIANRITFDILDITDTEIGFVVSVEETNGISYIGFSWYTECIYMSRADVRLILCTTYEELMK